MTHFEVCLSQISFLHIYITYTKSFYKLHLNFSIFTVLNKLLSMLLYDKIYHNWDYSSLRKTHEQRWSSTHTKGTIMTSNNITEAVTQKQSNGKMPQKYATHLQKNAHADVQVQQKPAGHNTEITGLHRYSPRNPPHTSRAPSIAKTSG